MNILIHATALSMIASLIPNVSSVMASEMSFSGEAAGELRSYSNEGQYDNTKKSQNSFILEPQLRYAWDNDRHVTTFSPYARFDDTDSQRTHTDIRELSYIGVYNDFEILAGISKVFWGVTESYHLVDVVNQVDQVDGIDGEDRLGQQMINLNYISDYGNFSAFVLPGFREKTYAGEDGRFRGPLNVDIDDITYTHDDGQSHVDYALRWSHYLGDLEWGLAYFKGTNRDPSLSQKNNTELALTYSQMEQYSIDAQYIIGDWLLKTEMLTRDPELDDRFFSTVTGFEYTFGNITSSGLDIGVLAEWLYDEREEDTQGVFYDHTFIGSRFAFNDVDATEIVAGGFINNRNSKVSSFRVEASRRINDNLKWEAETNIIVEPKETSALYQFKDDDYLQLKVSYFW